jgi:predicted nucleic acid-binding protein
MPVLTVYLDVCCLNRPFDDQSQARVRLEAEAVLLVLDRAERGTCTWLSSEVVEMEVSRNPDVKRRRRVLELLRGVDQRVVVGEHEEARALHLEAEGLHPFDALHVACAESGGADYLFTTDDRFLRAARRLGERLSIVVTSPLRWTEELEADDEFSQDPR